MFVSAVLQAVARNISISLRVRRTSASKTLRSLQRVSLEAKVTSVPMGVDDPSSNTDQIFMRMPRDPIISLCSLNRYNLDQ